MKTLMNWTCDWPLFTNLQVLLAVKDDALGLNLSVFNVYFVATQDNGNVLTNADQITMPVGYVLIGDSRGDVKHNDSTLSCGRSTSGVNRETLLHHTTTFKRNAGENTLNIIAISQASELLLAGGVPNVEFDISSVGVEKQWVDFNSKGS